jgi:hypothetical protein
MDRVPGKEVIRPIKGLEAPIDATRPEGRYIPIITLSQGGRKWLRRKKFNWLAIF